MSYHYRIQRDEKNYKVVFVKSSSDKSKLNYF